MDTEAQNIHLAIFKLGDKVKSRWAGRELGAAVTVEGYTIVKFMNDDGMLAQVKCQYKDSDFNGNYCNGIPCWPVRHFWVDINNIIHEDQEGQAYD